MLGGTSLTAVELTEHLLATYGLELSIEAVFAKDTLADLALRCTQPQNAE
jgi:Phosphopantetheine attachment site